MWVPVVLLSMSLIIGGITVYFAVNDPSFAVEEDYYQRGLDWDQTMAQKRLNQQLGWQIQAAVVKGQLQLEITDAELQPLADADVDYVVFHNARAAQQLEGKATTTPQTLGFYSADVNFDRAGKWVVRYRIQHGDDLYVGETRMELN